MIERAREYASRWENLNNLNFQVEDAAALSFLDETFDEVFATRLFYMHQILVPFLRKWSDRSGLGES